jgi:hypothetical protein
MSPLLRDLLLVFAAQIALGGILGAVIGRFIRTGQAPQYPGEEPIIEGLTVQLGEHEIPAALPLPTREYTMDDVPF